MDESKAADYVQQLAYKYDTFGLTHEFTTHAGKKITLKGGTVTGYGEDIIRNAFGVDYGVVETVNT